MNESNRGRRNVVLGADLLESRRLLNAHLPQSPAVHVASLHAEAATKPITGTLNVTVTFEPPTPSNPAGPQGPTIDLSGTGNSTVGAVTLTARSHEPGTNLSKDRSTFKFSYPDGSGTIKLGDSSILTLKYTGTGQFHKTVPGKQTPAPTYSYKGTATVVSGPNQGHVYKFTASGSGFVRSPNQTLRFTLK